MRPIPPKLKKQLAADPFMKFCIKDSEGDCDKPINWHHAFIYRGRQVNEPWALLPVCAYHHRPGVLDNDYAQFIGMRRATYADLAKYPRVDWEQLKIYLRKKYGVAKTKT